MHQRLGVIDSRWQPFFLQYLLPFVSSSLACACRVWGGDGAAGLGGSLSGPEMKRSATGWARFYLSSLLTPSFVTFPGVPKANHHGLGTGVSCRKLVLTFGQGPVCFLIGSHISPHPCTWFLQVQPNCFLSLGLCTSAHFPPRLRSYSVDRNKP